MVTTRCICHKKLRITQWSIPLRCKQQEMEMRCLHCAHNSKTPQAWVVSLIHPRLWIPSQEHYSSEKHNIQRDKYVLSMLYFPHASVFQLYFSQSSFKSSTAASLFCVLKPWCWPAPVLRCLHMMCTCASSFSLLFPTLSWGMETRDKPVMLTSVLAEAGSLIPLD